MQAAGPQDLLKPPSDAAIFLVLTVEPGAEDERPRRARPTSAGCVDRSAFALPEGELTCVVGIASGLWDRLFGEPRPAVLHPLPEFAGSVHAAVATPGDLLFHIRAHRLDLCFELAQRLMDRLGGVRAGGRRGARLQVVRRARPARVRRRHREPRGCRGARRDRDRRRRSRVRRGQLRRGAEVRP